MGTKWKKNLAAWLSCISFLGSLISLAVFLYGNTHPRWISELTFSFIGWLFLIGFLSGIIAIILVIMFHIADMEVYVFLSIFGIIMSIFVGIPFGLG